MISIKLDDAKIVISRQRGPVKFQALHTPQRFGCVSFQFLVSEWLALEQSSNKISVH